MFDPANLPAHLASLDNRWEQTLDTLADADLNRRQALRAFQEAYARAFIGADTARSAESLRRQIATAATLDQAAAVEQYESEVRFCRDQLRALEHRTSIARSLYSGTKQATT